MSPLNQEPYLSVQSRFLSLTRLHRRIDDAMRREGRPGGDALRLLRLRALRLAIKMRLAALMGRRPAFAL